MNRDNQNKHLMKEDELPKEKLEVKDRLLPSFKLSKKQQHISGKGVFIGEDPNSSIMIKNTLGVLVDARKNSMEVLI